ncbi:HAD family hydrolase [Permianibacter sp. IMCC34836]|uniref:HAD family hydrolase n=1 Tax=Permianibacter fluminis TaxID=2738515 RepID=UPI001553C767|nr:HAD family hydrolase [Permianibacter fluminis]NQD35518.1 HAD family hydrolase [Permianibacter fluminis]
MTLALFDLDHTLLEGDSDQLWAEFLFSRGLVGSDHLRNKDALFADYLAGRLDIHAAARVVLGPLVGKREQDLLAMRREFGAQCIAPRLRSQAMARIDWHRERGHRVVIITATTRFVAAASAELLDVGDLLATEPELRDGIFTGELTGIPCFREGKVQRLQAFCAAEGIDSSDLHFYSDSHNDLPLLQHAHFAYAVTPDAILREQAEHNGWPILDWFQPVPPRR